METLEEKVRNLLSYIMFCRLDTLAGRDDTRRRIRVSLKEQDRDTRHACADLIDPTFQEIINCRGGIMGKKGSNLPPLAVVKPPPPPGPPCRTFKHYLFSGDIETPESKQELVKYKSFMEGYNYALNQEEK